MSVTEACDAEVHRSTFEGNESQLGTIYVSGFGLRASRDGNDIDFTWQAEPAASGGYHLYRFVDAADRDRATVVGARVVDTLEDPSANAGTDSSALADSPPLLFYQVVGVCSDGVTEGPL